MNPTIHKVRQAFHTDLQTTCHKSIVFMKMMMGVCLRLVSNLMHIQNLIM